MKRKSSSNKKSQKKASPFPSEKILKALYRELLRPRLIEEKMLLLLRQGKVSKWFSGIGQEAIAVGATMALNAEEYILPLHRNLGVFTARNIPLPKLFAQLQGKASGFTQGRDRSFHFGTQDHHIVGMISHLGPQLSLADGIALAHKIRKEKKVTLAFTGEGGTSEGEFHEALNLAAVWDLPVIFLIENNAYALSTPIEQQFRCERLSSRALGYGIPGYTIDGNNILEVYRTISREAERMRKKPCPVLIECLTFRMKGHEEASGIKYVPQELFRIWEKRDPILLFEKFLKKQGILTQKAMKDIRFSVQQEIEHAVEEGFNLPEAIADTQKELLDVYSPITSTSESSTFPSPPSTITFPIEQRKLRFVDAISQGLRTALHEFPQLVFMGQDIADYGGVFKISEGFLKEFGKERIRNTPICESAVIGAGLGLAIGGMKAVVEMQFADFVSCGFTQIVNNLAKLHYRWGQHADVVIRLPTGAGVRAGPFHSQSDEAWFFHVPGLKVVYPAFPEDAYRLLLAAVADPNPVLFFEHKALYRSLEGIVPSGYCPGEIGKAKLVRNGEALSIIAYGQAVHWATECLDRHPEISADILDLRTLLPLDYEALEKTVRKTGRVLIAHEDTLIGGIGGEISAWITEHLFECLDAPILRVASLDTPVPFAAKLEDNFLPKSRLEKAVISLLEY